MGEAEARLSPRKAPRSLYADVLASQAEAVAAEFAQVAEKPSRYNRVTSEPAWVR